MAFTCDEDEFVVLHEMLALFGDKFNFGLRAAPFVAVCGGGGGECGGVINRKTPDLVQLPIHANIHPQPHHKNTHTGRDRRERPQEGTRQNIGPTHTKGEATTHRSRWVSTQRPQI